MQKQLSPRAFKAWFLVIWATGLIPTGLIALAFAIERHAFTGPATGLFVILGVGGLYTLEAAQKALFGADAPNAR
ncbi:MAG: hypothetical protein ACOYKM_08635 [Caulobacterales bacterium]|jgi:hypothetical protein